MLMLDSDQVFARVHLQNQVFGIVLIRETTEASMQLASRQTHRVCTATGRGGDVEHTRQGQREAGFEAMQHTGTGAETLGELSRYIGQEYHRVWLESDLSGQETDTRYLMHTPDTQYTHDIKTHFPNNIT